MYVKHKGKWSVSLNSIPEFTRSKEEHQLRSEYHKEKGKKFEDDYFFLYSNVSQADPSIFNIPDNRMTYLAKYLASSKRFVYQKDPRWADVPFGAANTLGAAGSLVFEATNFLILCYFLLDLKIEKPSLFHNGGESAVREINRLVVTKEYRPWSLEYDSVKKTFFAPKVKKQVVKEAFKDYPKVQKCRTIKELEEILGKPMGIGGHMFFMDELIAHIGHQSAIPYKETRLESFEEIEDNLKYGIPVPMRVNNSIFDNTFGSDTPSNLPRNSAGRYVICVGIENGNAIVIDANSKELLRTVPILTLYHAITADHGLTCVWDASPVFRK